MAKKALTQSKKIKPAKEETEKTVEEVKDTPVICGLVMPISEIDGCSTEHWMQVKEIIEEALESIDIKTSLVSDGDEVGIIQERIVRNLYDRPIVVCDVSCKNPNVMFELGLRLAFDMPTIIIKDDETNYSFDTSPIEHLTYPRGLNYHIVKEFKKTLAAKTAATLEKKKLDQDYSPFLKAFNKKRVANIETTEMSSVQYLLAEFKEMKNEIRNSNQTRNTKDMLEFISKLACKDSQFVLPITFHKSADDWNKFNEFQCNHKNELKINRFNENQSVSGVTPPPPKPHIQPE